jgi:ADP-ribosyl-[dinitrogen reductase] hydrolase
MTDKETIKGSNSSRANSKQDRVLGGLWGSLVGDALGVPVEFRDRTEVQRDPVTGMRENGSHHQPKGTWSDDGALILCTTDSLVNFEFDTQDMGHRFVRWMNEALWTATGVVFDIGMATTDSLMRVANGTPAESAGGRDENSNGNGSLMRIIPVALRFAGEPTISFSRRMERVSAITHGHDRSKMACVFFGLVVRQLLLDRKPQAALDAARVEFTGLYERAPEFERFRHHLTDHFHSLPEGEIISTGYVLHTLHAALWCLLNTQDYRDCVLKAVNLGGDTDTTGCVAGGLAGVTYGMKSLPSDWIGQLARKGDVDCLFREFADLCSKEISKQQGT